MTAEILGAIRLDGDRRALRLERTYATDVGDLWSALTEPERLLRWFATVSGDLREGGKYVVVFDEADPSQRTEGTILECQAPERLRVSWGFAGEDESFVLVELSKEGDCTRLVLEHTRVPVSATAGYGAGWQTYLEQLEAALAGDHGHGPNWDERWTELMPAYKAAIESMKAAG